MNSILEIPDKQQFCEGLCGPGLRKAVVAIICLTANLINLLTSLRLRLDVDIGKLGIELGSMPKQSSIG